MWSLVSAASPALCAAACSEYRNPDFCASCPQSNFLKSCRWSPDGTCILTASDDNILRIFPLPPDVASAALEGTPDAAGSFATEARTLQPTVRAKQGECIYDVDWYPAYFFTEPMSCCFASTSRAHPVHLWDANTGKARTTYRTYDKAEEVTATYCIKFHPDCERLVGGLKKKLVLWALSRPGREYMSVSTQSGDCSQRGVISCVDLSPTGDLIAAGAFSGDIGTYDSRSGDVAALLLGHSGGITHVQFSRCGYFLYSGARHDDAIICWDIRNTTAALYSLYRNDATPTNQRLSFDIQPCGRHLFTGNTSGTLQAFDLLTATLASEVVVADETLNGVSIHPFVPLVATSSGHRRFVNEAFDQEGEGPDSVVKLGEASNRLAVWAVHGVAISDGGTLPEEDAVGSA